MKKCKKCICNNCNDSKCQFDKCDKCLIESPIIKKCIKDKRP